MRRKRSFYKAVGKVCPNSGLLYFHDHVPLRPGMAQYDSRTAEDLIIFDGPDASATAEFLYGLPLNDVVEETVLSTLPEFVCSEEEAACTERAKRQATCGLWHQLRRG